MPVYISADKIQQLKGCDLFVESRTVFGHGSVEGGELSAEGRVHRIHTFGRKHKYALPDHLPAVFKGTDIHPFREGEHIPAAQKLGDAAHQRISLSGGLVSVQPPSGLRVQTVIRIALRQQQKRNTPGGRAGVRVCGVRPCGPMPRIKKA